MGIAYWAAAHRRSILFFIVIVSLTGIGAGLKLPVALFPHVDFPRVVVSLETGDRPADQMVIAVTRPVEQAAAIISGLLVQIPLVIIVMPLLYKTLAGIKST